PGREGERLAGRIADRRGEVCGLDRVQAARGCKRDVVAVDGDLRRVGRERLRVVGASNVDVLVQLEVPGRTLHRRIGVDEHAVGPGGWEVDRLRDSPVRADRRVAVDDRAEIVPDDDQV